jgi:hypothetical protein
LDWELEFISVRFGSLSLSPKGNDSGTVFVGMVHSGVLADDKLSPPIGFFLLPCRHRFPPPPVAPLPDFTP